ncbi:MAG: hypothetical protein EHM36_00190 [Deltaproteobacteria bacterium]|nr:MAG: hypothetical protein EHM36_00190 [Deltaproteobacteria bacterium]
MKMTRLILAALMIVAVFGITGCALFVPKIMEFNDKNYKVNKQWGEQLLVQWSFVDGFIDGTGATDKKQFPITIKDSVEARALLQNPAITLGTGYMTEIAKKAKCGTSTCYNIEDYYRGYALGFGVRLGVQSAIEIAKQVIPMEILQKYVPWILGIG